MSGALKPTAAALGLTAVGAAAAFAYGVAVERNRFTVRHETLPVLAPGARPITVLHLSDVHLAPWQEHKIEWIRSLVIHEPDLIVNTGDNWGHPEALDGLQRAFEPFGDVPGVYVNGSNDYFGPTFKNPLRYFIGASGRPSGAPRLDVDAMEALFQQRYGWWSLNNAARAIELRGSRLEFFGVNDAHRGWDRLDKLPGVIEELRENVGWQDDESGPEAVTIGVTHSPYRRVLDAFVTQGADVIFAGHTHGGQVRVPGLPPLVTNCDIPREQAQGLSVWPHARRAAYLQVSAGIGTSIYAPFRFACPPEAVVMTLTAADIGYS